MANEIITYQELIDAKVDAKDLGESTNEDKVVSPRYGEDYKSVPMVVREAQAAFTAQQADLQDAIDTALAAGAGASGWTSDLIVDGTDIQTQINLYGAKTYDMPAGGYPVGGLVRLSNGDIVKSTIPNNTNNPNLDMTGWYDPYLAIKNMNPVEKWGAKGDGVTDDSAAIQSAINDLSAEFLTTGQEQTLLFNGSKTYMCRQIALKAGVHYQGVNGRARIKKTPAGAITDETVLKWWRIWNVSQNEESFNSIAARKVRHRFSNLVFDGNRDNMNWSGGYAQEQAASLFLTGNVSSLLTAADQRNKFQVDNCLFVNSVADGIGVWYNADVIVNNEEAINCFRGGLVASGGNTRITTAGYVGTNARIDYEIDSAGFGGTHRFDWVLNNVEVDKNNPAPAAMAGSDLCISDGGTGIANNVYIYSTPVNFNGKGAPASNPKTRLQFNNCTFMIDTTGAANYIYPCDTEFNHVKFIAKNSANPSKNGLTISWGVGANVVTGKRVVFNNGCEFLLGDGVSTDTLNAAVQSYRVNSAGINNTLEFNDTNIIEPFLFGVSTDGLISVEWNSGKIAAITAFRSLYTSTAPSKLSIGEYEALPTNVNMLSTNVTNGTAAQNTITFKGTRLDRSKSSVTIEAGGGNSGRVDKKIGNRIILSDTPPVAAMSAYNGDVLRLNTVPVNGPYEWICTTANFANTANTWKPAKWNVGSFTTATLPTLTAFDVGVQNIDTTLNKIVTWTGTAWI